MTRTTALAIAATILLIVALTMGEGGVVSQLAESGPGAKHEAVAAAAPAKSQGGADARQAPASRAAWYAADPQPVQSAIPVYTYPEVHIAVPQAVVDPKVAAASEIQ